MTFIAGATAGALAGLLLAPEKGQKTRELLLKRTRSLRNELDSAIEAGTYLGKYRKTA